MSENGPKIVRKCVEKDLRDKESTNFGQWVSKCQKLGPRMSENGTSKLTISATLQCLTPSISQPVSETVVSLDIQGGRYSIEYILIIYNNRVNLESCNPDMHITSNHGQTINRGLPQGSTKSLFKFDQ